MRAKARTWRMQKALLTGNLPSLIFAFVSEDGRRVVSSLVVGMVAAALQWSSHFGPFLELSKTGFVV